MKIYNGYYVINIGVIDWYKYGFRWDEETQSLEPVSGVPRTENGNSNMLINIELTKTNQTRPECHREHLKNRIKKYSHISRKKSMNCCGYRIKKKTNKQLVFKKKKRDGHQKRKYNFL